MGTRAARALRGSALAALATLLAALAHTLGGGIAPSPLFCAVLLTLAAPLATAVVASRPAFWRTAAAIGVSQLLFHLAFSALGDFGTWAPRAAAHVHGETGPALAAVAHDAPHVDMTLAHVAAALVTIAVARRGERVVDAVRTWLLRRALAPAAAPLPVQGPRPRAPRAAVLPRLVVVLSTVSRRGPPSPLSTPAAA